jgi:hypothetical protein
MHCRYRAQRLHWCCRTGAHAHAGAARAVAGLVAHALAVALLALAGAASVQLHGVAAEVGALQSSS